MGAQTLSYAACQDLTQNIASGYSLLYTLTDNGNGTSTLSGAMERPATAPAWVAFGLPACPDCGMLKGSAVVAKTDAASPTGTSHSARPVAPMQTLRGRHVAPATNMAAAPNQSNRRSGGAQSRGALAQARACRATTWAATAHRKWCRAVT